MNEMIKKDNLIKCVKNLYKKWGEFHFMDFRETVKPSYLYPHMINMCAALRGLIFEIKNIMDGCENSVKLPPYEIIKELAKFSQYCCAHMECIVFAPLSSLTELNEETGKLWELCKEEETADE